MTPTLLLALTLSPAADPASKVTVTPDNDDPVELIDSAAYWALFSGKIATAAEQWRDALAYMDRHGGKPERRADILHGLGQLQAWFHDYPAAERTLRIALRMQRELKGGTSREAGMAADALARLMVDMGRFREAEEYYLAYFTVSLAGKLDENLARAKFLTESLGRMYLRAGRYDDAEECARRAIKLVHREDGVRFDEEDKAYWLLADVYCEAGRVGDADQAIKGALARRFDWAKQRAEYAPYLLASGEPDKAESLYTMRLKKCEARADPEPGYGMTLMLKLGEAKARRGDPAGRRLLVDAIREHEKVLGPVHPDLARALETYARLFPDQSAALAVRAARIRAANRENEPRGFGTVFGFMR